jgi:hypothetical protein
MDLLTISWITFYIIFIINFLVTERLLWHLKRNDNNYYKSLTWNWINPTKFEVGYLKPLTGYPAILLRRKEDDEKTKRYKQIIQITIFFDMIIFIINYRVLS